MTKIIKFTSSTCGPCRMLGPIWNKTIIKPEFTNIVFEEYVVDKTDDGIRMATQYEVNAVPTIIIEVDDVVKEKLTGMKSEKTLTDTFKKYL